MAKFVAVAADFSVAPQLEASDFAAAAAQGIRTVINNRPDGEAPGQLTIAAARAAAEAAGLQFRSVPITLPPPAGAAEAFAKAVAETPGPHLAYCRSGTRSITLWALSRAMAGDDPDALIREAAAAGYDLAPMRALLAAQR